MTNTDALKMARERIVTRQLEVTPEGPATDNEAHYLAALDLSLVQLDQGKFDPANQCPECALESLDRDEVDVGVGVMSGPAFCNACGWSESDGYPPTERRAS